MQFNPYFPAIAAVASIAIVAPVARADSPLTSTRFWQAYEDVEIVRHASEAKLDDRVMAALSDPDVPHDVRAAIVNALGWQFETTYNARQYLEYVAERHDRPTSELAIADLTAEETFALGYLLAMDDYFTMKAIGGEGEVMQTDALNLVEAAIDKQPKSLSIFLVRSLVRAQEEMDRVERWCGVYQGVDTALKKYPFETDMRPEAVDIIMGYIEGYQDYCN
ncbi:hypothetical protein [Oxynema aestuarii]|jgi:hypothetical protein|uniref:Uncharacterized protein n=1 Tax=Oxynema aestuarii AP17 TaxID=2064643 RepID=A0A6H1U5H1_9CYAN|nr:hypothetical protein [Oxynema aestuarii]QIZ73283.1 hypothetical protein HCG48_23995 [Oxynema aestuarii AP17]RMH77228.1 MAG: hypothetical protein D6680_05860 [Cyanobacteria bacterium J007]